MNDVISNAKTSIIDERFTIDTNYNMFNNNLNTNDEIYKYKLKKKIYYLISILIYLFGFLFLIEFIRNLF